VQVASIISLISQLMHTLYTPPMRPSKTLHDWVSLSKEHQTHTQTGKSSLNYR